MKKDWETNIAKNSKFNKILGLEREKARKGLENLADFAFYYSCYFGTFFYGGSWPWKVLLTFTFVANICARLWALGFDTPVSMGREETLTCGCRGPFLPFFLMRNSWQFFLLLQTQGLLFLYSLQVWTFANWNNFGCCCCWFLRNLRTVRGPCLPLLFCWIWYSC